MMMMMMMKKMKKMMKKKKRAKEMNRTEMKVQCKTLRKGKIGRELTLRMVVCMWTWSVNKKGAY